MAVGALPVQSDPTLLADIRRFGTFDSAACYQCGSCTLSCELVSDSANFPRRSIRYGLLGLREPLLGSLAPWICHDCGDCSTICPRQADPRISMVTLRRFLSAQYDWSGLTARLLQSKAWYLGALIFAALLTFLLILGYHLWKVPMSVGQLAATDLGLEHMFPIITYYTLVVVLLPLALLLSRIYRVWRLTMADQKLPLSAYAAEAWTYVYQSVTHSFMRKCPEKGRWRGHWMLACGTVMMLTIKTFGLRWFQTDNVYPIYNPQRWIGYVAAGFILYGIGDVLIGRWRAQKEIYKETTFNDLVFPVLIVSVVLSGLAAHILRYCGFGLGCHYAYALHVIVASPLLLIEMSFGKWSHMVYRPVALYFCAVRERAQPHAPAPEAVPNAI
jgi:quinone-modifying oxidoreductase, subunit QmoC